MHTLKTLSTIYRCYADPKPEGMNTMCCRTEGTTLYTAELDGAVPYTAKLEGTVLCTAKLEGTVQICNPRYGPSTQKRSDSNNPHEI